MLLAIPGWWSLGDAWFGNRDLSPWFPFWAVLIFPYSGAIFFAQLLTYWSDIRFFDRRWTLSDICRLASWSTISSSALLMVAIGIEAAHNRSFVAIFWLLLVGIVALVGAARLRSAEGFKPRAVKSGELYKRSLVLSRRMGVRLQRVSVVPFGRGRLTNAYGGWNAIAVTDDYGHWLQGSELDFVIGHELAHVKHRHSVKTMLAVAGMFALAAALMIAVAPTGNWRVLFNFSVILAPLMGFYFLSRHFEYTADRTAVAAIGETEPAIRALKNTYRRVGVPARSIRLQELFLTHPSLARRLEAIARLGQLCPEPANTTMQAR
jgi:Zn-dependent protease with chaperone function